MSKPENQSKAKEIFNFYGFKSQSMKYIEEGSRLVSELARLSLSRMGNFQKINFDKIVEEIADVVVMVYQLTGNTKQFVPRIPKKPKSVHEEVIRAVISSQYAFVVRQDDAIKSSLDNVLFWLYQYVIANNIEGSVREQIKNKIDRQMNRIEYEKSRKSSVLVNDDEHSEKKKKAFTVVLPWFPKELSPNARVNRFVKHKNVKAYRHLAKMLALETNTALSIDKDMRYSVQLTFNPPARRHYDDDNLIASVKPARDGIADAIGVNDKNFVTLPVKIGSVKKFGEVIFEITEIC